MIDPVPKHHLSWRLTVGAVIERDGRFLVVEETNDIDGSRVFNQPAGHVDPGESILDAVQREVLEETGLSFTPEYVVGVYQLRARNGRDYVRICFSGSVPQDAEPRPLDADIHACHWMDQGSIALKARSAMVLRCIDDYQSGKRWPLEVVDHFLNDSESASD